MLPSRLGLGVPAVEKFPKFFITSVPSLSLRGSFPLNNLGETAVSTRSEGFLREPAGLGSRLVARSTDRVLGAQHMLLL